MSSREAFEAWVDSNFPFKKDRFDLFRGEYKSQFTKQLWQSWQASREGLDAKLKSAENNDVDARCHVAELEAKCAALAAELSAVETIHNDAVFITDEHYEQCPPEVQKMIRSLAVLQIPAYQAFLAEVRAQGVKSLSNAVQSVISERQRQQSVEGWTPEHDDEHAEGEMAEAAACYAMFANHQGFSLPAHWPWSREWWKQSGQRRDLVKAGALILAEIERIDRAAKGEK